MRRLKKNYTSKYLYYLLFATILISCNSPGSGGGGIIEEPGPVIIKDDLYISSELPGDLPAGSNQKTLAEFAWNEFFALNWASSFSKDSMRDSPDKMWKFKTGGKYPDLAVWETFIHRRELQRGKFPMPDLNKGLPSYGYSATVDSAATKIDPSGFWNNLDENNEIGSCYVVAYDSIEVLYMAKTNLAEYNYVRTTFTESSTLSKAKKNGKIIKAGKIVPAKLAALIARSKQDNAFCNDEGTEYVCLPCGDESNAGAIEIKTGWRFLVDGRDDLSRFITREVLYYEDSTISGVTKIVPKKGTMGLIGMHIIRKMKNYPSFVFASFEQMDVRNKYTKELEVKDGNETKPLYVEEDIMSYYAFKGNNFDPKGQQQIVPRAISDTISNVNTKALNLIDSINSTSLLKYYRLIGVQGEPVDHPERSTDENYFMANYVIESDSMLTRFHGSFGQPFNDTITNVVYNGHKFTMGGCQGCHGRAQLTGNDFSFIFPTGASGAGTPDVFQSIGTIRSETSNTKVSKKLEKFIKSL